MDEVSCAAGYGGAAHRAAPQPDRAAAGRGALPLGHPPRMIRIHHLNNSRSQRVLWLLEEIGEPYEIVLWKRDAMTNLAPAGLRAIGIDPNEGDTASGTVPTVAPDAVLGPYAAASAEAAHTASTASETVMRKTTPIGPATTPRASLRAAATALLTAWTVKQRPIFPT